MLDGRGIEPAAVLAPELAERDGHELRRGAGGHIRQVGFEILAIAVELADEFAGLLPSGLTQNCTPLQEDQSTPLRLINTTSQKEDLQAPPPMPAGLLFLFALQSLIMAKFHQIAIRVS